jgi:hypothetical protein
VCAFGPPAADAANCAGRACHLRLTTESHDQKDATKITKNTKYLLQTGFVPSCFRGLFSNG